MYCITVLLMYYSCISEYKPELNDIVLHNLDLQIKCFFEMMYASFYSLSQWKSS